MAFFLNLLFLYGMGRHHEHLLTDANLVSSFHHLWVFMCLFMLPGFGENIHTSCKDEKMRQSIISVS